jgi:hypothetical protein
MLAEAQRPDATEQPGPPEALSPEQPEAQPLPVSPPEHVVLVALLDAALLAAPQLPSSE